MQTRGLSEKTICPEIHTGKIAGVHLLNLSEVHLSFTTCPK